VGLVEALVLLVTTLITAIATMVGAYLRFLRPGQQETRQQTAEIHAAWGNGAKGAVMQSLADLHSKTDELVISGNETRSTVAALVVSNNTTAARMNAHVKGHK